MSFAQHCMVFEDLTILRGVLIGEGWDDATDADDALVQGLAWIVVSQYFVGDSGGERVEAILELKQKAAEGLLRKVDIPQSKNRYMTRTTEDGSEALHIMWRQPVPNVTEIEGRAALLPSSLQGIRALVVAQELPAFAPLRAFDFDDGSLNITLLNADALEPLTPPDAIVNTYRMVKTDKVTP